MRIKEIPTIAYKLTGALARAFVKNSKVILIAVIGMSGIAMSASALISIQSHPTVRSIPLNSQTRKKTESSPAVTVEVAESDKTSAPLKVQPTQQQASSKPTATRKGDSTNPQWLACQTKINDLYVAYNSEIARINQEKNAALAEVDRMYEDGELAYDPDGNYLEPYEQANAWQMAKSILNDEYTNQLQTLNDDHQAKWNTQLATCESTYSH